MCVVGLNAEFSAGYTYVDVSCIYVENVILNRLVWNLNNYFDERKRQKKNNQYIHDTFDMPKKKQNRTQPNEEWKIFKLNSHFVI